MIGRVKIITMKSSLEDLMIMCSDHGECKTCQMFGNCGVAPEDLKELSVDSEVDILKSRIEDLETELQSYKNG